jgi:hypothetical protein
MASLFFFFARHFGQRGHDLQALLGGSRSPGNGGWRILGFTRFLFWSKIWPHTRLGLCISCYFSILKVCEDRIGFLLAAGKAG